jgi:hypothetical protein
VTAPSATFPPATQEVIFLDPDDDLGTVRAKLESTAADEVYLVIPKRSTILRTPLEFRILARLTHELSSETIIVTTDGGRRSLARGEGLRTKRSVRSLRHLSRPPGTRSWGLPGLPDWLPLPSFTGMLLTLFLVGIAAVVAFGVLPVMKVTVSPQTLAQKKDFEILVDPNARQPDVARSTLPGEVLQQRVEVVGSTAATGQRRAGRDRARGEIAFISQNPQPVILPRGTVVVANNGAKFMTDLDLQVPAFSAGTAKVGITAQEAGTLGNVDVRQVTHLEAPGVDKITVRNDRPTGGGTDRDAKSVTPEDVNKLKEQLQVRAREQALAELYARAGGERSLVQQSVRLRPEGESFEPGIDAEADQVNGRLSVVATAVVFNNAEFNGMVQRLFLAGAGPGFDLPAAQLGVGTPQVLGMDDQRVRLKTSSEALMIQQVNADDLTEKLRWKSVAEARTLLGATDGLAGGSRIELSPAWAPRAYRVEVAVAAPK